MTSGRIEAGLTGETVGVRTSTLSGSGTGESGVRLAMDVLRLRYPALRRSSWLGVRRRQRVLVDWTLRREPIGEAFIGIAGLESSVGRAEDGNEKGWPVEACRTCRRSESVASSPEMGWDSRLYRDEAISEYRFVRGVRVCAPSSSGGCCSRDRALVLGRTGDAAPVSRERSNISESELEPSESAALNPNEEDSRRDEVGDDREKEDCLRTSLYA